MLEISARVATDSRYFPHPQQICCCCCAILSTKLIVPLQLTVLPKEVSTNRVGHLYELGERPGCNPLASNYIYLSVGTVSSPPVSLRCSKHGAVNLLIKYLIMQLKQGERKYVSALNMFV